MTCKEVAELIPTGVEQSFKNAGIEAKVETCADVFGTVRVSLTNGDVFDLAVLRIFYADKR